MNTYNDEIFSKKEKLIQSGDFLQIKKMLWVLKIKFIYYENINYFLTEEDFYEADKNKLIHVDNNNILPVNKDFIFQIKDVKKHQVIQMKISNIFNNNYSEICYIPIYKNVIFEKEKNKYIAAYLIVLDILQSKKKSVIKLIFQ